MPIVADSYMGIFMPPDISSRISKFLAGSFDFPFVGKDELMAAFYLFGKNHRVTCDADAEDAKGMAKKTVEQVARDIRLYMSAPKKMNANFTRGNYTKRSLQIAVDNASGQQELEKRISGDPAILSDCLAQHIAYYQQGYFFELFQPFTPTQLPPHLRDELEGRMLLLGFNAKDRQSLPFKSSLLPFFDWMQREQHAKNLRNDR